jgi:DNA-binding beta-propeller fold protein YncE
VFDSEELIHYFRGQITTPSFKIIMKTALLLLLLALVCQVNSQTVTTVCGQTTPGSTNGSLTNASFYGPNGLYFDSRGYLYIADIENHQVRKIDLNAGNVSTLAGSSAGFANGLGTTAKFNRPSQICADSVGNIYVADFSNNRIRKIDTFGGVTSFAGSGSSGSADGLSSSADFSHPTGVFFKNGTCYISDFDNSKLRKIVNGMVTTVSGMAGAGYLDGSSSSAKFNQLYSLIVDKAGNIIIADRMNHNIRKIDAAGNVTTIAGSTMGYQDGASGIAKFNSPSFLCVDSIGNIYVSDLYNHKIRKIDLAGNVTTIAGAGLGFADGVGTAALFNTPCGISLNKTENILYVADFGNNRIRQILLHTIPNVGLKELALLNNFTIYPNPATNSLFLKGSVKVDNIIITNILGTMVYEHNVNEDIQEIDLKSLTDGVYFVKISLNGVSRNMKFIKGGQ